MNTELAIFEEYLRRPKERPYNRPADDENVSVESKLKDGDVVARDMQGGLASDLQQ
ncbi:hypothetical protein [Herbaspirillum hiltneri]|uniref:hypothetical protein n=1 Tax=Herbaspirillum hiltneri TaxID=341045 RepID=UPI00130DCA05|nr:hypothetical protein [Herbaspirillum hiltneri]